MEQLRVWLPTAPVMAQVRPLVLPVAASAVQDTPAGSGSLTLTPSVVCVPLFSTRTSKPISAPALTGPAGLAVLVIEIVAGATVKHSVVVLVCEPNRYWELASGVYSARQQYFPAAAAVSPTV